MNVALLRFAVCTSTCLIFSAAAAAHRSGHSSNASKENSKIERGLQISPVAVKTNSENRDLVGLGSYLVNAASACVNCHSCPTYLPGAAAGKGKKNKRVNASNYMAGGVPFPVRSATGVVNTTDLRSANLTPVAAAGGLPGGLTFVQFRAALTEGHRTLTDAYSQFPAPSESYAGEISVMPWRIYRNFETPDLEAIYEYLKAIPGAKPGSCSGPGE